MHIYAERATSGVHNWAILRDWHGGVLTNLVISYPILELASIFWYHWMCNIQEGTIHMLTYSYTESNQPQSIKIRATPTFLVCLSPRVKCTQHPICGRSLTFMLCSLYPMYLGCIYIECSPAVFILGTFRSLRSIVGGRQQMGIFQYACMTLAAPP